MKEYIIQYGNSVLDRFIFRPGAIKHLPKKIRLWVEIKALEHKRDRIIKAAIRKFNGKLIKDEKELYV